MNKYSLCVVICFAAAHLAGCAATPFHGAAWAGRTEEVRSLLDRGANVNAFGHCQFGEHGEAYPPLHCAIAKGHLETVRLLLDRGADRELRNTEPKPETRTYTPLDFARLYSQGNTQGPQIAQLLVERGADCNAKSGEFSIFDQAAYNPNGAIIISCLKRGVDVDASVARFESLGPTYDRVVAYLKKMAGKETPVQSAVTGVSREELSTLVQAAVDGSVRAQAKAVEQPRAISSDIDKPSYKLTERPDDFALVVGIGKYSDIPEAQFAQRDAEAVRNHLIAEGFPSRNVIELLGEKAGRSSMEKFLETWLPRNVNENSRVFFYFSGHGAPDPKTGEAYLLPWDADAGFLENTGYPIKRLYEKLGALKVKEVIVAMDACFSGAGGRSVLAKGARPLVTKVETASVPRNLTVFAAAGGDQITSTLEDQGHGTFTYYFLKGLGGGAKDASGTITTKGLYDYLKPKVQDAARRQNRDQAPVLHALDDRKLVRF